MAAVLAGAALLAAACGGVMRPSPTGIDINSPRFQAVAKACNAKS